MTLNIHECVTLTVTDAFLQLNIELLSASVADKATADMKTLFNYAYLVLSPRKTSAGGLNERKLCK